ncbi:hypothetical protein [Niallia taxi]|uniref:hypothetical protein n=1 Tax=Niallia taxi TaxID=2499688 RepID=UPI002E2364DE|nr:hypothetical protein [Niallia taxi]
MLSNKLVSILHVSASIPYCQPYAIEPSGASTSKSGAFSSIDTPILGDADQINVLSLISCLFSALG